MTDIRIQHANDSDGLLPVFGDIAARMEAVRERAFELFTKRGGIEGHDLDDWVAAEREVLGWPAVELKEANGDFRVDVTLPGFAPTEIELTATPSELIVHAASTHERKGGDEEVVWSEFGSNDVYRRLHFPKRVDADKVTAELQDGILKVRAPKLPAVDASSPADMPTVKSPATEIPIGA